MIDHPATGLEAAAELAVTMALAVPDARVLLAHRLDPGTVARAIDHALDEHAAAEPGEAVTVHRLAANRVEFGNGARITLGVAVEDTDVHRHAGAEYAAVVALDLDPTGYPLLYLEHRIRTPLDVGAAWQAAGFALDVYRVAA